MSSAPATELPTASAAATVPDGVGLRHLPQLDGLRAVAVSLVLADHFWPGGSIGARFPLGLLGVKLFFVLSGFLITRILLRSARARDEGRRSLRASLLTFYGRRSLRIFPPYFVAVLIVTVLALGAARESLAWNLTYTTNFYVAADGGFPWPVGHFWSLALEEQFYLVWPLVIFLVAPRARFATIVTMAAVGPLFRAAAWASGMGSHAITVLPFSSLDALGLGALLAFVEARGADAGSRRVEPFAAAGALCGLVLLLAVQRAGQLAGPRIVLWHLLAAVLFYVLVARTARGIGGPAGRLLESRPVAYVGRISYGIYIFHPMCEPIVRALPAGFQRHDAAVSLAKCVAAVAAAALSWHVLEGPVNSLKRLLPY